MVLDERMMCLLNRARLLFWVGYLLLSFVQLGTVAIPAQPFKFRQMQPDGTYVVDLQMNGDEFYNVATDSLGYIVAKDQHEWTVYCIIDDHGNVRLTQYVVGKSNPREVPELQKGLLTTATLPGRPWAFNETKTTVQTSYPRNNDHSRRYLRNRRNIANGTLQHLVILIRFSDHKNRTLPSRRMYEKLFNQVGGDPDIAPSGSVRDFFLNNSYGKLSIESTVLDWISLPETESYYAEKHSGLGNIVLEAMRTALEEAEDNDSCRFNDFDADRDGKIDALTFIHSGSGAEWGEEDCDGNDKDSRIWSHHRNLKKQQQWCGQDHVCMSGYQIVSGVWGYCSGHIAHIGVISHEVGHLLGLPDMYDGVAGGGNGIGSYSVMANAWGFDGNPPLMDPWSKKQLGWVTPTVLSKSGDYSIEAVYETGQVYQINQGFPRGEYLLIENRQPNGIESLPQGGLAIWHIDEAASTSDSGGFRGQAKWPGNGKHYKVSLLQADGAYHLERGENFGDAGDLWRGDTNNEIGPSRNNSGPYPNTDSYQGGYIKRTDIIIRDISRSGNAMTFTLILPQPLSATGRVLNWFVEPFLGLKKTYFSSKKWC